MFSERDTFWMQHAIQLAETARAGGEVPVGAVLIADDHIIGEGFNSPISHCDPTAHAEILALRAGATQIKNYRLVNSTLYVTLEPCVMCVGALVHARVKRIVYGATDPRAGAIVSAFQIIAANKLNHQPACEGGLLSEACGKLLIDFFREKRC
ncbi:MAG: tRNA adenosine(34) deaminase TadA [Pseudomonadota bacterium]